MEIISKEGESKMAYTKRGYRIIKGKGTEKSKTDGKINFTRKKKI
jgi:hypothetical protein